MTSKATVSKDDAETARMPVGLEAFINMAERWRLTTDEQIVLLGSPGRSTFFKWKKDGGAMPADTTERLSHLLAIWKSLRVLFTIDQRGEDWVRRPNDYFDGASALEVMLGGKVVDLYKVRVYLDAQRGA